jgi:hypothetical protein
MVPDGLKRFRTVPNRTAQIETVPDGSKRFQTVRNGSRRFETVPDGSKRFRTVPVSDRDEHLTEPKVAVGIYWNLEFAR